MARLPDPYGVQRRAPQGAGPVIPSLSATGEAGFGASLIRAGREADAKREEYEVAMAGSALTKERLKAESEIAAPGTDWRGWQAAYDKRMAEATAAAESTISNPRTRELFRANAEEGILRGQIAIKDKAWAQEADEGRARLDQMILDNIDAAMTAGEADRKALLGQIHAGIDGAEARGYLTAEQAVVQRRTASETYAKRAVSMLDAPARLAAVSGGIDNPNDPASVLRAFEGMREVAYPDMTMRNGQRVNSGYRVGYGSDTVTLADGRIVPVSVGTRITQADADRDLNRRVKEFESRAKSKVGAEEWGSLPANVRSALISVAYNYGNIPDRIVDAVRYGDAEAIAQAVEGLAGDNSGINRERRLTEAAIIRGGGGSPADYLPADERMEIAREARKEIQQRRKAEQDEFLGGLDTYLEAVRSGADVSAEIASRYSDDEIAARVDGEDQRRMVQAVRDDTIAQSEMMKRIRGATPEEIAALQAEVAALTPDVTDDVGLALAPDRAKAQEALAKALAADQAARQADPARYAAGVSPDVQEAAAGIGQGGEEAYAAAVIAEQQRLGLKPRVLPVDTSKAFVAQVNDTPADKRGALVSTLADQWGEAWPLVLNEMKADGLDAATYHAALVADDPALAERIASLATTPIAELKKGLESTEVRDLEAAVEGELIDFRSVFEAGDPTGAATTTMNELRDVAVGLALQEYRRTGNAKQAVRNAYDDLIAKRYDILDSRGFSAYVPRRYDSGLVEDGAATMLTDEALAKVIPFGGDEGSPDFIRNSRIREAARRGTWVTNAEGDGLVLMVDVDGRWMPVNTEAGPYGISFDDAMAAGEIPTAEGAENARRVQEMLQN